MPPRLATKRNLTRIAVIAAFVLWNCACSQKPPSAAAPVEVSVMTVTPHPVTFPEDYVAQTEAINAVEIRPRVGGMLEKRVPVEGEAVKTGQLLFIIDREPYIAALAQAKASLAQSQAASLQSQRDLARDKSLSEIDAVSQQELDAAVAKDQANLASIDAAKAAVRSAEPVMRVPCAGW
jgi:membrane fusion protein (multidrug efflux system)